MKITELRQFLGKKPFFTKQDILLREPSFSNNRILEWQKKGYIVRVANNFYIWADHAQTLNQNMFLANNLYKPSYISSKTALRFYNFIPEAVYSIFSVTTRKTKKVESSVGHFEYQSVKPSLFFGYTFYSFDHLSVLFAEPEKALLDFWYLNSYIDSWEDVEGMRLNFEEIKNQMNSERLKSYLDLFEHKRLSKLTGILLKQVWS